MNWLAALVLREVVRCMDPQALVLAVVKALLRGAQAIGVYDRLVQAAAEQLERLVPNSLDAEVAEIISDIAGAYAARLREEVSG